MHLGATQVSCKLSGNRFVGFVLYFHYLHDLDQSSPHWLPFTKKNTDHNIEVRIDALSWTSSTWLTLGLWAPQLQHNTCAQPAQMQMNTWHMQGNASNPRVYPVTKPNKQEHRSMQQHTTHLDNLMIWSYPFRRQWTQSETTQSYPVPQAQFTIATLILVRNYKFSATLPCCR